jgi:hypothetical protein
MPVFDDYVRACRDQALDELGTAEGRMIHQLESGDSIDPAALVAVVALRATARRWQYVVDLIDQECVDPADALVKVRDAARTILMDQQVPRHACPIEQEFARVRIEAARDFYRATAHVDALTILDIATGGRTATGQSGTGQRGTGSAVHATTGPRSRATSLENS